MLNVEVRALDEQWCYPSTFDIRHSTFDIRHSTFLIRYSAVQLVKDVKETGLCRYCWTFSPRIQTHLLQVGGCLGHL